MKLVSFRKKLLISLFIGFISVPAFSADEWILGAQKFSYSQKNIERSASQISQAELLPKLILEQISSELTRYSPEEEILERKYRELTTERLSLFLQLSKEIKSRDSIVISSKDSKKLEKNIADANKKIKEIQDKIDSNLEKTQKLITSEKGASDEISGSSDSLELVNSSESKKAKFDFLKSFSKFFEAKDDSEKIEAKEETVKLYKDSESSLFDFKNFEQNSPEYDKAVRDAKINGLISGEMITYGNYVSVSCTLTVYPGKKVSGVVTEVGSLDDLLSLANNLARRLVPFITNNLPVELYFYVYPEECNSNVKLSVDGVVYNGVPEKLFLDSGIHKLQLECEGYLSKSFSYNFSKSNKFKVSATLAPEKISDISFNILNPASGKFYANGQYVGNAGYGNVGTSITVNGENVIGQFISYQHSVKKVQKEEKDENGKIKKITVEEEGPALSFFYYIPSALQEDGNILAVKSVAQDNQAVIDKRRIWTYRGYSAVVLTLPFTLYATGHSLALNNAAASGISVDQSQVAAWNGIKYGSMALTGAAAGFFIYEVVRYLMAANSVLPAKAKVVSEETISSAVKKSEVLKPQESDSEISAESENSEVNLETEKISVEEKSENSISEKNINESLTAEKEKN